MRTRQGLALPAFLWLAATAPAEDCGTWQELPTIGNAVHATRVEHCDVGLSHATAGIHSPTGQLMFMDVVAADSEELCSVAVGLSRTNTLLRAWTFVPRAEGCTGKVRVDSSCEAAAELTLADPEASGRLDIEASVQTTISYLHTVAKVQASTMPSDSYFSALVGVQYGPVGAYADLTPQIHSGVYGDEDSNWGRAETCGLQTFTIRHQVLGLVQGAANGGWLGLDPASMHGDAEAFGRAYPELGSCPVHVQLPEPAYH